MLDLIENVTDSTAAVDRGHDVGCDCSTCMKIRLAAVVIMDNTYRIQSSCQ